MNKKCLIIIIMAIASAICFSSTAVLASDYGCTLTPGYWKTHSKYGPAPYDDCWTSIGEDRAFYSSGQTVYEVINTPPKAGNAYYILSFQYIAAVLNQNCGASFPWELAGEALIFADTFFSTHTPDSPLTMAERAAVIAAAAKLAIYNSGLIGPGHCDD